MNKKTLQDNTILQNYYNLKKIIFIKYTELCSIGQGFFYYTIFIGIGTCCRYR